MAESKIVLFLLVISASILLGVGGCEEKSKVAINSHSFNVDIADSVEEKTKGLMFREELEENQGMLFVYEDERVRGFWMKNTLIPLDMIFIDANLTIVDINKNALPCEEDKECRIYYSKEPAMYVLEINGELSNKLNIFAGDKVTIALDA